MRFSFSLLSVLACSVASFACAEDIVVDSQVAEVTIYPDLAEITRRAEFDLPAGSHRLVLRNIPQTALLETLQLDLSGAKQRAMLFREEGVPPRDAHDPRVQAAEAVIDEVMARISAVEDEASRARTEAAAARTAIGFLEQLGSNEGLAEAGAEALRDITLMIAAEAGAAGQQALDAQIKARAIETRLEELEEELEAAEQALEAIAREDEDRLYMAIDIEVAEAGSGALELRYLSTGDLMSEPLYEWHLTTGDSPKATLKRSYAVRQETGENWQDVVLTISTLQPGEQGAPSHLSPLRRRIQNPEPALKAVGDFMAAEAPAPMVEPEVIEEDRWSTDSSGPGVTYRFGYPVTLASGADIAKLDMDALTAEAELRAVAVPLRDTRAYRVATLRNTFGEDLLESYEVPHFVDGKLVTVADFSGAVAGQEFDLGFGVIRGLQLSRNVLQKSEGERGVLSRSNQQDEVVEISVENLTDQTWPLHLLDRVPYSEQEDLEITWTAEPRASEENVEKQRGILAWNFELAPGAEQQIRLDTTLSWPDGMILR